MALVPERSVVPTGCEQNFVGSHFDDRSVVTEHDDLICGHDGRQFVSDHEQCAFPGEFLHRTLHVCLVLGIERGRRLVEQNDRCAFEECARNGDPLPLSTGQCRPALTDTGVPTPRKPLDDFRDARDPSHVDVFYVDNAGQVQVLSWDPDAGVYRNSVIRPEPHAGGEGTAPPGTSVSVIAMTPRRLDAFLADNTGTLLWFEWTFDAGWKPAVPLSDPGQFPPGAPVTAISHLPPQTMEIFGVTKSGFAWTTWCADGCDGTKWVSGLFASSPTFLPGTKLSALSRDHAYEELYGVDGNGSVWRAFWTATEGIWTHPGYAPFGSFSNRGMLDPGATIATHARSADWANLLAVDRNGIIWSEWWLDGFWNPQGVPWESTIASSWGVWNITTAVPNSVPAMLGNVGAQGDLDVFWLRYAIPSGKLEIWTARATRGPNPYWVWSDPSRIDN